jgi:hypothetical protein
MATLNIIKILLSLVLVKDPTMKIPPQIESSQLYRNTGIFIHVSDSTSLQAFDGVG